jgi:hypothetical protein
MVLFDPSLAGTSGLSNEDPPTLAGNTVYARCFQAGVILDGTKETEGLPRREFFRSDVFISYSYTNA